MNPREVSRAKAARDRHLLGVVHGVAPYHKALELLARKSRARMTPAEIEEYEKRGLLGATGPARDDDRP